MPSPQKSGQAVATTGIATKNISNLAEEVFHAFESKVKAPRNPKLVRNTELIKPKIRPSMYMHMMNLDTDEKLAKTREMCLPQIIELLDMSETTHQKVSSVDIEQAMFQPFPSEIYFQCFEPFQTYEVPLQLRNNDRVPRLVKVVQEDSPYFKIISPDDVSHKVAPGMASTFRIQFTPEDKKDYQHELVCMTEREKFVVPVLCIGARAILDFPDEVNFGVCPVKHPANKVLFVRNIGNRESKCSFEVEKPFRVCVESGVLPVGGSAQVTLEFQPEKVGDHKKDLCIKYDTGERIYVSLYGAAVDANVRLDKSTLRIDNTYISMANQRTITIHNRSDVLVHFKWSPFATKMEEDMQKEKFCNELQDEEIQEKNRFLNECIQDPTLRDRLSILTRTFKNRKNVIKDDPLLFTDDIFKIFPLEGDIWPCSTTDITVVFKPTEVKSYQQIVFCDITGRESRLPLKVRGDGMGPKLCLSYDTIDIGDVFASSVHTYEIVLINQGNIDAIFSLVPDNSPGSRFYDFRFDPVEGIVLPGGHQAVEIMFRSENLGKFSQEFRFSIDASPDQLELTIKGNVIGPTFNFDVPRLKFGTVSYGFNHTKMCSLRNTSLVPMTYFLRIPDDGTGEPSISSLTDLAEDSLLSELESMKTISSPHEFDITPAQGTIPPESESQIHITLCSNTLKKYDSNLVVDIKGVGKEMASLPISAKCIVPSIQILTPTLNFGRCFINFPYEQKLRLYNDSDLMAKYTLKEQIRDELSCIVYGSAMPKGLIEPRSTVEVPVLMQVTELDEQEVTAYISIFGDQDQHLSFVMKCIGEGPVVHISPSSLNWGPIEVLTPNTKTVTISNESLIPADFITQMMRPDSVWNLEPQRGTVPPESAVEIAVTAVLDDSIKFLDKMTISIVKGPIVTIPVQAKGFGTTIVVEPTLTPSVSLGPHFAKSLCVRKFKLTNSGRRHQALTWSNEGFAKRKSTTRISTNTSISPKPKDAKGKATKYQAAPPEPVFKLLPPRVSLEPKQSSWLTLEGYCAWPRQVCESIACHAIIGKDRGKEKIIKSTIRADFISPVIELSANRIDFRVDKEPSDITALIPQTKTFSMRNVSSLPLSCVLRVQYPFQILGVYGSPQPILEVCLALNQELEVTVRFDPAFKDDLASRVAEGDVKISYQEHPHVDSVQLRGEVNFPNLDFDKRAIDFGCILNDTEVARFLDITNTSPLPVVYKWTFLVNEGEQNIKYNGEIMKPDPEIAVTPTPRTPSPLLPLPHVAEEDRHTDESASAKDEQSEAHPASSNATYTTHPDVKEGIQMVDEPEEEEVKSKYQDAVEVEESLVKPEIAIELYSSDQEDQGTLNISLDLSKGGTSRDQEEEEERAIEEQLYRPSSRLSSRHQPTHPIHTRLNQLPLLPWLEPGTSHVPNGVEEIFDILPLYGTLDPGEAQRVTFTYYGHSDVSCNAKAICDIQGGPKYEIKLQGEASLIEYRFSKAVIMYGKQMFDQISTGEIILENNGKVGFNFSGTSGLGNDPNVPGIPVLEPDSGFVAAHSTVCLKVHYLPGLPEKFKKTFEIQIAHFEPTIITVMGEGVFPRLSLDLPRYTEKDEYYASLLEEAKDNLDPETLKQQDQSALSTPRKKKEDDDITFHGIEHVPSDLDIQMEVERLILRDFAAEHQDVFTLQDSSGTAAKSKKKRKFPRVRLTDYLLDFGHVILGNIRSHIVRATNTSYNPISFSSDRSGLQHSGFNVELDRVKQLPGYPDHETVDFKVTFDPRGANLPVGRIEAMVPINVVNGPQVCVRLRANVAVPELLVSSDMIDFDTVPCGQCKVVTIQLYNEQYVKCEWTVVSSESQQTLMEKHMPMHLRKKLRKQHKPKSLHFEMMPSHGHLAPGQRMNVQVKFMPTESRFYTQRLTIRIAQSTSRVSIGVRGVGQEPRLDFEPNLVEFGPILPHGVGDEVDVVVRNPSPFAVEFYSLNFDKQYLLEEKILRMMRGYDEDGNLLLPPRLAGEELPPELLQYYREQEEKMKEAKAKAKAKAEAEKLKLEAASDIDELELTDKLEDDAETHTALETIADEAAETHDGLSRESSRKRTESDEHPKSVHEQESIGGVGDLEITPVSAAIARHLGIDLTPEARAARNRRGIAIIVHGPPISGKTNTAVQLAKAYGAARLTIDGIVMDAISNGNTPSGLKAREMCAAVARGMRDEEGEGGATNPGGLSMEAVAAHVGQSNAPENKAGSIVSTKKASVLSKQAHSTLGSKAGANAPTMSENTGSQVPSSPPPLDVPPCRRLSVSASVAGEQGLMSCVLPEELMVEIIAERLQLNDCQQGVVFDSLETLFCASYQSTLLTILKAINNRKYIYFFSKKLDYNTVKMRKMAMEEENARAMVDDKETIKLDELDEDEYDALSEEKKEELENLALAKRKERIKREMEEKNEKERIEKEKMMMLEEKRLEEENSKKKGRKGKGGETGKRSVSAKHEAQGKEKGNLKANPSLSQVTQSSSHEGDKAGRPESRITDRSDTEDHKKSKKKQRPLSGEEQKDKIVEEVEELTEQEQLMIQKFKTFEKSHRDILYVLQNWDRAQSMVAKPPTPDLTTGVGEDDISGVPSLVRDKAPPSGKKTSKKEREKERLERERLEREKAEKEKAERERLERLQAAGEEEEKDIGVPLIEVDTNGACDNPSFEALFEDLLLPPVDLGLKGALEFDARNSRSLTRRTHFFLLSQLDVDTVLDGMGLGPSGPPIPPPATFAVVPYPVKRKAPSGDPAHHYEFIASPTEDTKAASDDAGKEESQVDESSPLDAGRSESKKDEVTVSSKERKKRERSETAKTGRRSSPKRGRGESSEGGKSPPPPVTPASEIDQLSIAGESVHEYKQMKLTHFRWVVPAYSEIPVRIQFSSDDLGQFDQTLSFEITGTRRRYQLFCRGVCAFPTISREPRVVFTHRRKAKVTPEDIVSKKYLIQEEVFEFGPLLCGKTRERYKDGRYPENMEKITIMNTSPLTGYISFCYQYDSNASTFLLDPPNMILEPNESKQLSIWAYPKTSGRFMDTLVCCVRENPEPICFNVACYGVRPELELDRKQVHFEKVLLHRKDSRTLYLRNSTMLPVSWHVAGMENMGDDFSLNQESGIIDPRCEFALQINFRATKAANVKKAIRLEVSDATNIMGLVQTENIQVTAEAYDVALDMSFPKGADGGLDFGSLRVQDETKQTCSLKNKGKYEIGFNFVFEHNAPGNPPVDSLFSVLPQKGTLIPNDRPTQVQVIFRSQTEVTIRDLPLLKCQVIEPSIGDGKEVIASIPIRLSVRSVFSKYIIFPTADINFGPMILNTKKSRTFTIENKGEFDFKYTIAKMIREAPHVRPRPMVLGGKRTKSRDGSSSSRSAARVGKAASIRQDMSTNQTRLSVGCFTIYPGFGTILPGGVQNVTIDCVAENMEKTEEFLCIDVTDRDPDDNPSGIPYRLLAEGCLPSISTSDFISIFEEHRICKNLNVYLQNKKTLEATGVYGEDDNKFMFCNVIVGQKVTAKFKISNPHKVPVDVTFSVKPVSNKVSARIHDIFDVEVPKAQILPHSHVYATVSFCPPAMNTYVCHFEATVDGIPSTIARNRSLSFEICGDGNLPRVSISKPTVRNKNGEPFLMFQRLLINRKETLPLVLKNEGTFPSKVNIMLEHGLENNEAAGDSDAVASASNYSLHAPNKVFALIPSPDTKANFPLTLPAQTGSIPYTASVVLAPDETASFDVVFKPVTSQVCKARIRVTIVDNQFEEHRIQLLGEGFQDEITFDNLHADGDMAALAGEDGILDIDSISHYFTSDPSLGGSGDISETLMFGDCCVGTSVIRVFSLTNHSTTDTIRFRFEDHPNVKFSPNLGHVQPGSSKEITATFQSNEPTEITATPVKCNVTKISFPVPLEMVADWDDRMRTVKWTDAMDPAKACARPAKKKVVETEPEPEHSIIEDSSRQLDLLVSANVDYASYECDTSSINFRDTLMFQSRVYEFEMKNNGKITMEYSWQIIMEDPVSQSSIVADRRPSTATHSARSICVESIRSLAEDYGFPFSISPPDGKIKPGMKQNFVVRFNPSDVSDYQARMICSVSNLPEDKQGPVMSLKGRSLMPFCHFELPNSDYLSSSRRNPDQSGPGGAPPGATLDPNTRVIEFSSVGVGPKTHRKFWIMNPTGQDYSFRWICMDVPDARVPPNFICHVKEGQLSSGKKLAMHFTFVPTKLDACESFWKFVILDQNINIPFLLVGHTSEPEVSLSTTHVNFQALLVGHKATKTVELINNESTSFNYTVVESSCRTEAYSSNLAVSPMQGNIPANSRVSLEVCYNARTIGEANFNIMINVARKTKALCLNVKANAHALNAELLCENSQGDRITLSSVGLNEISLGEVELREKATRQLFLVNTGKYNFNFSWTVKQKGVIISSGQADSTSALHLRGQSSGISAHPKRSVITINPDNGSVQAGTRKRCLLTFQPKKLGAVPVAELTLNVHDGPTYLCHVTGIGVNPGLEFSFESYNFGACFLYKAGMPINTTDLIIRNKDSKEISVECLQSSNNHLDINFGAVVLPPGGTSTATFTFYPRETIAYRDTVTFLINGLSKREVEIKGEGTEMRVEVAIPKQKLVRFGALRLGQAVKHVVPIINRSPVPINLTLSVTPVSPALQDPTVLRVLPTDPITLDGKGGSKVVEVYFTPKTRIPPFTEEVMMECAGMSQPLFIVTGSCQGLEICLDQDSIPFGAVVQGSSSKRRFVMLNRGDIGAGFCWNASAFAPDFSITPVEGYISPGMDVAFTVTFHPRELSHDIRYDNLKCAIEGGKPLKITLTGMCIGTPALKEVVSFSCHVRGKDVRNVVMTNRSNLKWNLTPVIEGEFWTGNDTLIVDPQQTKQYEITYKPLSMTTDGKKHQGSVFFPLPDGGGLLYNLLGQADPPKPASSVSREVPCKTAYVELLPITNWLRKAQRFKVTVEMIKPDKLDPGTTLKGLDYIDVPGSTKRDYKLNFFAHKEGTYGAKIVFKNEKTLEYLFYYITLRATSAGVMGTIELDTPVRRSALHTIKVENPLPYPVNFQTECKVPDINLPPQFTVPPNSEGTCMFEYQPLRVGEGSGKVLLSNNDLGLYTYDLILHATPAGSERITYFKTNLGSSQVMNIKFQNFARQKTDYVCKVDNSSWSTEKNVTAAPASSGSGTEVTFDVTFEPINLGPARGNLTLTSPIGGEYSFPLEGFCDPPKPQGPFVIRNKSNVSIPFKNVFPNNQVFQSQVDNPNFHVKASESIRGKKSHNISVSFDSQAPPGSVITGKLTLTCHRDTVTTSWVFYLKGVIPDQNIL